MCLVLSSRRLDRSSRLDPSFLVFSRPRRLELPTKPCKPTLPIYEAEPRRLKRSNKRSNPGAAPSARLAPEVRCSRSDIPPLRPALFCLLAVLLACLFCPACSVLLVMSCSSCLSCSPCLSCLARHASPGCIMISSHMPPQRIAGCPHDQGPRLRPRLKPRPRGGTARREDGPHGWADACRFITSWPGHDSRETDSWPCVHGRRWPFLGVCRRSFLLVSSVQASLCVQVTSLCRWASRDALEAP